jgi:hypothetical protein
VKSSPETANSAATESGDTIHSGGEKQSGVSRVGRSSGVLWVRGRAWERKGSSLKKCGGGRRRLNSVQHGQRKMALTCWPGRQRKRERGGGGYDR